MAMEISVKGSIYKTDYADRMQAQREEAAKAENGRNAEKATKSESSQSEEKASNQNRTPHDAYISSEKSGEKPNGLYYVGQDENGNKKVYFNDPKKEGSEKEGGSKSPKVNADAPNNGGEKYTANTDKVEREIRELKEKKKKLEQQLKAASGDEKKTKELENKLAQVERELSQKDTDTYRKQNTEFTDQ